MKVTPKETSSTRRKNKRKVSGKEDSHYDITENGKKTSFNFTKEFGEQGAQGVKAHS
jgi:hypothetical protein